MRRPDAPVIGYQRWDSLLFLHWAVPANALRPLIPQRLSIDEYEGRAYVTFTPFTVMGARLRLMPALPGLSNFHELNARTYVRLGGRDPGVWFFSLDASRPLPSAIARLTVRLPYFYARIHRQQNGQTQHYTCERIAPGRKGKVLTASWTPAEEVRTAAPASLEHFLVERYFLFSRALGDKLWRGQVHHRPWPLQSVADLRLQQTLDRADQLPELGEPILAQYSAGVDVEFFPFRLV
jgi:uncharacterized protein YqjF (DUF2071 family)